MNIEQLRTYVKQKLELEPTGHDFLHIQRVVSNARKIMVGAVDQEVVLASCYVHDLIDHKLETKYKATLDEVKDILHKVGLTLQQVNQVLDIIQSISFSSGKVPDSLEGKIVQDADRLDALGAIGIARTFSYGGKNNRLIYDPTTNDGTDSRSHFYQKLLVLKNLMNTDKAKKEAEVRTEYMIAFLETLEMEIT